MIESQIFQNLRTALMQATSLGELIPGYDNGPEPGVTYGVLTLLSVNTVNLPEDILYADNPLYAANPTTEFPFFGYTRQQMTYKYQFDVYAGENGSTMDYMQRIVPWKDTPQGQEAFSPLTLHAYTPFLRLPEMKDSRWTDRATTTLDIRTVLTEIQVNLTGGIVQLLGRVPVDQINQAILTTQRRDASLVESSTITAP